MWDLSNSFVTLDNAFYNLSGISNIPAVAPTVISNGGLDVYDNLNGSVLLAWGEMLFPAADSYNVYVDGVLSANINQSGNGARYLLEDGSGLLLLEDGSGYYLLSGSGGDSSVGWSVTVAGLVQCSYNPSSVAAPSNNSARPQNMPPTGVVTPSRTYKFNVVAVASGAEIATSHFRKVTVGPDSIMLKTTMKRLWPFPNSGLD
jgi:hypothetical protein